MAARKKAVPAPQPGPIESAAEGFPHKTQDIPYTMLEVGDQFLLYGTELAKVTKVDKTMGPAGIEYTHKDRTITGLFPGKDTYVTRIVAEKKSKRVA